MKKTRIIALVLVAAMTLMGAGYALWSDQLTMSTEVKTGYVDVSFNAAGESLTLGHYVNAAVEYTQDWNDDNGNGESNWDIAKVKINNFYPTAKADVKVRMQNNSTIPVSIEKLDYVYGSNWGSRDEKFHQISAALRFYQADGTPITFNGTQTVWANPWDASHAAGTYIPVGGYAELSFGFSAVDGNPATVEQYIGSGTEVGVDELSTYTFEVHPTFTQYIQP